MTPDSDKQRWIAAYTSRPLREVPLDYAGMDLSPFRMRYLTTVLERCPRGGTAIETGIGTGYDSIWLSKRGVIAEGIDNVPEIVERANQAANMLESSARFRVADMFDLHKVNQPRVDVIHHQGVLEHYGLLQPAAPSTYLPAGHIDLRPRRRPRGFPSRRLQPDGESAASRSLSRSACAWDCPEFSPANMSLGSLTKQDMITRCANRLCMYNAERQSHTDGTRASIMSRQSRCLNRAHPGMIWDVSGQQTSSADSTGPYTYIWDNDSRKTATQNPTGINLTATLDAAANRLTLQDNFGLTTYQWDIQSRLASIWNPFNERTTLTWDSLDREQHRVLGNGGTISHTWDQDGRETLIENRDLNGVGQAVFTNTYSAVSNRLTVLELDGTQATYAYDAKSQLITEQRSGANAYNTSYVYAAASNRIQKYDSGALTQYALNAANELLVIAPSLTAPTTQTFDPTGNTLTSVTGEAITTNTWSPDSRLTNVAFSDGTNESYAYRDDALRTKKTNTNGTSIYTWDHQNVLLETDIAGNLQAHYTDYPGYWGGLASQRQGSSTTYYGYDSPGNVRVLVSPAGVITDSYSYRATGEELESGSGSVNPYWYAGKYGSYRDRSDVSYSRGRIVAAIIARWLSRDARAVKGTRTGNYGFVRNNPANFVDPSGNAALSSAMASVFGLLAPPLSGQMQPIMNPSCSNQPSLPGIVNTCCSDYLNFFNNLQGDIAAAVAACMVHQLGAVGDDSNRTIREALRWLASVCSGNEGPVCVWCLGSNPGDGTPKGWPNGCGNDCITYGDIAFQPYPISQAPAIGVLPIGWPLPWHSWPIEPDSTCQQTPLDIAAPCKGLLRRGGKAGGPPCIPVAFCSGSLPGGKTPRTRTILCGAMLHELVHSGGIWHTGKGENNQFGDVIYAIGCCLCQVMDHSDGNCKDACHVRD